MNGKVPENLVFDSTYLLPAFGIEVELDSGERITETFDKLIQRGSRLAISDLSPLECFLKAFRIAERTKKEEGKEAAKIGFLAVTRDSSTYSILPHSDERIFADAFVIRKSHKDPFDCFIFATARALDATLVTEDASASKHIESKKTLTWKSLKQLLK